jgi:hypothetical protein
LDDKLVSTGVLSEVSGIRGFSIRDKDHKTVAEI